MQNAFAVLRAVLHAFNTWKASAQRLLNRADVVSLAKRDGALASAAENNGTDGP